MLPNELLIRIISELDSDDLWQLMQVNKHFYFLLTALRLPKVRDYSLMEIYANNKGHLILRCSGMNQKQLAREYKKPALIASIPPIVHINDTISICYMTVTNSFLENLSHSNLRDVRLVSIRYCDIQADESRVARFLSMTGCRELLLRGNTSSGAMPITDSVLANMHRLCSLRVDGISHLPGLTNRTLDHWRTHPVCDVSLDCVCGFTVKEACSFIKHFGTMGQSGSRVFLGYAVMKNAENNKKLGISWNTSLCNGIRFSGKKTHTNYPHVEKAYLVKDENSDGARFGVLDTCCYDTAVNGICEHKDNPDDASKISNFSSTWQTVRRFFLRKRSFRRKA